MPAFVENADAKREIQRICGVISPPVLHVCGALLVVERGEAARDLHVLAETLAWRQVVRGVTWRSIVQDVGPQLPPGLPVGCGARARTREPPRARVG